MESFPVYGIKDFVEKIDHDYFYSNDLSVHLKSHLFINLPHKHSTYIVIFFLKGSGEHQIDFENYKVNAGSVFLLSPGQVHNWKLSPDTEGYVFFHAKEFYDDVYTSRKLENFPFFYLQKNYPLIILNAKQKNKANELFSEINKEYKSNLPLKKERICSLVDALYIFIARLYHVKEINLTNSPSAYLKIQKLKKLIDVNYINMKFPAQYAELMNISTRHLSRLCVETLGCTTNDLIIERNITEAKRILINQDLSIAMVSDQLGYEDPSYFTRLFKKKTGLAPKQFQAKSMHHDF